jgi:hypothetical protein
MGSRSVSAPRLAIALGLQIALAVLDAAITGSALVITGTVLLVPLRETMTRAADGSEALVAEIERSLRDFQASAALDDRATLALRFRGVTAPAPA